MEIWKDVKGFEEKYQVSNLGRVKSLAREIIGKRRCFNRSEMILKISRYGNGYEFVVLCGDVGERLPKMIGHLVLEAFVSERPKGMVCCHNNGNKNDNSVENLRWDTQTNNLLDKIKHGTHQFGEKNAMAILTDAQVIEIKNELKHPYKGIGRRLAEKYGVSSSLISAINVGKRHDDSYKSFEAG